MHPSLTLTTPGSFIGRLGLNISVRLTVVADPELMLTDPAHDRIRLLSFCLTVRLSVLVITIIVAIWRSPTTGSFLLSL